MRQASRPKVGVVESFNGRMRDETLNESLFLGLDHARYKLASWRVDYNTERTDSAIGDQTPPPLGPYVLENAVTAASNRKQA
jgi:transposase InsO family protein